MFARRLAAAGSIGLALLHPAFAQDGSGVELQPDAYLGLWYEIARTPTPFQQQCEGGVTAFYEQTARDSVRVVNRCDLSDGGVSESEGLAEVASDDLTRFEVSFPSSPDDTGEYVIEAVGPVEGDRHSWAAVTAGDGEFGWILAPSPELSDDERQQAEEALEAAGIDPAQLQDTEQPPSNYEADG